MAEERKPDVDQPDQQSWLRRLFPRRSVVQDGDTISAQIGEDARNIVVGKNVIQIGTLQVPFYLAAIIAAGVLIIAGIALFNALWPLLQPVARMSGQFNIAVAQFSEIDTNGREHQTDNGLTLSRWVYDALKTEYATNPALGGLGSVEIWHDSPGIPGKNTELGIVAGDTAAERATAAGELANKVGAHMVIYGVVNAADPSGVALEFYIAPELQPETSAIIGQYQLGAPIPIQLPFDTSGPLGNLAVGTNLQTRTTALFYLTAGLTLDLLGRSQAALEILQEAETKLTNWQDGDGKEILYFFIAREALFLARQKVDQEPEFQALTQAAEEAARRALAIQPAYVRAQVVLGGVYLARAQRLPPVERLLEPSALNLAITAYEQAVALAEQDDDLFLQSVTHLALATALRTQGQTYYLTDELTQANQTFDQATAMLDTVIQPLTGAKQYRLLAQAYQVQGAAYWQQSDVYRQQGDPTGQKERLKQASAAFVGCIEQGEQAPFDQILHEEVIAKACQPAQADVEQALRALEGG